MDSFLRNEPPPERQDDKTSGATSVCVTSNGARSFLQVSGQLI